ncbi:hypothetical protein HOT02_gp145 [Staphylococcus phage phiSA_BS2]|uniref:Uncharacterized protein n=1 Tax=Staphylococcus phage phiSA_BS2 TaxID=2126724 RepID=A0A2R3ZXU6_9CAUD|nr:hypothetical protein HOT02_gp145 [Staphylococcus phage phiSA_BS2]AVR55589.1 hypothetical protein phiSABS2_145 [Staphylococcus phage phiSA_BS2]
MITEKQNHFIDVLESKGLEVILEGNSVIVNDTEGNFTTMEFLEDDYIEFSDRHLRGKEFSLDQVHTLMVTILNKFRI